MKDEKLVVAREKKPWPSYVASFLLNDMAGACKRRGQTVETCGVSPYDVRYLLELNYDGHIDRRTARDSVEYMLDQHAKSMAAVNIVIGWITEKINIHEHL